MNMYKDYSASTVLIRRIFVLLAGIIALPVMLFWKDRARFYSYLHRIWSKTSEKPVWMDQAEKAACDFY
ncbi:YbfA family protein [Superficieibacter sp. HKU1]|uniref:YbfA family protein n=1 Tax=Superficieibacter sp. HKU1 TaxID=3031919 RepID=UPI0023E2702E|nr:YbfA family protein [Superficieibacter sp. HKU1]WES69831.1 YbfA family protein [Superficieibacter sp. HKU1]